jgi:hypothetical protein
VLPVARRAFIIGMLGLAIQALGFVWTALHLLFSHWSEPFGPRHLIYEPGVLLVIVGFLVSLICVPVALEVTKATEEDVEIPLYEPVASGPGSHGGGLRQAGGRLARYSAGRSHPATGPDRLP